MDKGELIQKIEKLPHKHSIVLSQILMEELSFSEVAQLNSLSEEKVRQLYVEALNQLSNQDTYKESYTLNHSTIVWLKKNLFIRNLSVLSVKHVIMFIFSTVGGSYSSVLLQETTVLLVGNA